MGTRNCTPQIALIPNAAPILIVVGVMGWAGLKVNVATAMLASVSMGLTVDSSIHYISGYRRARQRGLDFHAALRETLRVGPQHERRRAFHLDLEAAIRVRAGFGDLVLSLLG